MEILDNCSLTNGTFVTSDNLSDCNTQNIHEPKISVTFVLLMLLSALTVFTNALILAAFYGEKKLRTYTNSYILNITIADFVVGLVCMPLRATVNLYDGWNFGQVLGILFIGFQNSILSVSVCGVVVICIDRYIATFYPIKHFQRKSIRKATIVNISTWILSFGIWISITCVWDFIAPSGELSDSGLPRTNYSRIKTAGVFVFILRFAVPFLLITGLYLRIYFRVKAVYRRRSAFNLKKEHLTSKGKTEANDQNINNSASKINDEEAPSLTESSLSGVTLDDMRDTTIVGSNISLQVSKDSALPTSKSKKDATFLADSMAGSVQNHPRSDNEDRVLEINESQSASRYNVSKKPQKESTKEGRKAMKTLTFIILAFVVTWLPNALAVTIYSTSTWLYDIINSVVNLIEVPRWISYSNSLINPLAYAMAQPLIRDTVVKILFCKKCK
ncbi:histamine H1 receptor-like [Strongylocentrotus purpuratus]|uniref:G-protein coupled receptors family 1 profile domain-containing protein n=1 Tax=Strongylocentrotus purpuratus TaxID=7668 RepID=A0A7M7PKQ5_STRPU|nr:histamine H1 receptor-like [Strongylocentrotus purpuratus]